MTRQRHRVAAASDLADGDSIITDIEGLEIAVFRIAGEFYALANYCVHQGGPLCEGELSGKLVLGEDLWDLDYRRDGEIIACPWHRWKFNIKDGTCIDDDRYSVPQFDVQVDGDDIYILV